MPVPCPSPKKIAMMMVPSKSGGRLVLLLYFLKLCFILYNASMLRTTSGVNLVVHHRDQQEREIEREREREQKKKEDRGGWVPFRDLWDHPFNIFGTFVGGCKTLRSLRKERKTQKSSRISKEKVNKELSPRRPCVRCAAIRIARLAFVGVVFVQRGPAEWSARVDRVR